VGNSSITGGKPSRKRPFTQWSMARQEGRPGSEQVLAGSLGHSPQALRRSLPRCIPQYMGSVSTQELLRFRLHERQWMSSRGAR